MSSAGPSARDGDSQHSRGAWWLQVIAFTCLRGSAQGARSTERWPAEPAGAHTIRVSFTIDATH
jgi:hypothetical protein